MERKMVPEQSKSFLNIVSETLSLRYSLDEYEKLAE